MKISAVKFLVLEDPEGSGSGGHAITRVEGLRRIQYTHAGRAGGVAQPLRQNFLEVHTDAGIVGRCDTSMNAYQADIVRYHAVGRSAWEREGLFQQFLKGTRWVYQPPGWFGAFDNCLWDILGQASGLPIYALVGRVRDRLPVYLTGGDMGIEGYLKHIATGREMGIETYKFHSYKGGKADIPIYEEVRQAVGPEYGLITDPVCSYDLREAIEVGRVLEELDFVWLEEPMHEQKMNQYQALCRELTIPVLGTEMLMHDIGLTAQWLIQEATDRLRGNARHGTTQVLKLAHLAEMYGTHIELNGTGALDGLVHAHLGCCIDNTDFYEFFGATGDSLRKTGERWGLLNAPLIEEGHIAPPDGPGWGAEWDQNRFDALTVEVF